MSTTYIIATDSNSELSSKWREKCQLAVIDMPYNLDGEEKIYNFEEGEDIRHFYQRMRDGAIPTTMQRNAEEFKEFWMPYLEKGLDVLHFSFSSKLSGTYDSACIAQKELAQHYPDRKIMVVDTKAICPVLGLLLIRCAALRDEGKSMEEVAQWMEENYQRGAAFFSVESLEYLKRGGRISNAAAFFGSMLQIKPMLHLDAEGGLAPVEKIKGRKKAIRRLAEAAAEKMDGAFDKRVFVIHADCSREADSLIEHFMQLVPDAELVEKQYVGPVIGAHVGPGMLAIVYFGKDRSAPDTK